jgi:hypothetical protein
MGVAASKLVGVGNKNGHGHSNFYNFYDMGMHNCPKLEV